MNDFLKAYGASLIAAVVGLTLVVLGLIFKQQAVLDTGLVGLGGSIGIHLGGNTNVVPIKTQDAIDHIEAEGGVVKGKVQLLSPKLK